MPPATLSALVVLVENGTISGKIGKEVFEESYTHRRGARARSSSAAASQQISDEAALWEIVDRIVAREPEAGRGLPRAARTACSGSSSAR